MGRPRKWSSDAERMRAKRRGAGPGPQQPSATPAPRADPVVPSSSKTSSAPEAKVRQGCPMPSPGAGVKCKFCGQVHTR